MTRSHANVTIRNRSRQHERVRVLVSVKASPEPSSKYGDTVCVAGTLMTPGAPEWIRLYPVPFRYLDGQQQFKKYSVIDVRLNEATQDQRPESAKVDTSSITILETLPPWKRRAPWVEPLVRQTMCELQQAVDHDVNAQSLGAIRPRDVAPRLDFEQHGPWSDKQRAALARAAAETPLFGPPPPVTLEPPRLSVWLRFSCHSCGCRGHRLRIIDWELTALQAKRPHLTDSQLKAVITDRFMNTMFRNGTDPIIFVGNQHNVQRRKAFTVLGVYYPKAASRHQDALF